MKRPVFQPTTPKSCNCLYKSIQSRQKSIPVQRDMVIRWQSISEDGNVHMSINTEQATTLEVKMTWALKRTIHTASP
jgi:hypothetical protein